MRLFDFAPQTSDPANWPVMLLWASTVFLEAEGESSLAKLAVAYVPKTRAITDQTTVEKAILGKDGRAYDDGRPFETFSCWNDDYRKQAMQRLRNPNSWLWEESWRAACAAHWTFLEDPTKGAYFYLNVEFTREIRGDNSLPTWWDIDTVPESEIKIGLHTFRRKR